jgi:hypothetical protein
MTHKKGTLLISALMLMGLPSAWALPTVKVNNVDHYLADYDEATNRWFESANGYCVTKGFRYANSSIGTPMDVKPIAELDGNGRVIRTFPDYQNGKIWVVQSVSCGN